MPKPRARVLAALVFASGLALLLAGLLVLPTVAEQGFLDHSRDRAHANDDLIRDSTRRMMDEGRQTFRFDTFGSETFFGDAIKLHRVVEGSAHGGVGPGVSPKTA